MNERTLDPGLVFELFNINTHSAVEANFICFTVNRCYVHPNHSLYPEGVRAAYRLENIRLGLLEYIV